MTQSTTNTTTTPSSSSDSTLPLHRSILDRSCPKPSLPPGLRRSFRREPHTRRTDVIPARHRVQHCAIALHVQPPNVHLGEGLDGSEEGGGLRAEGVGDGGEIEGGREHRRWGQSPGGGMVMVRRVLREPSLPIRLPPLRLFQQPESVAEGGRGCSC